MKKSERRVIVFGTFDGLHKGHLNFLRQAKKLGNFLIVVVARDKYVEKSKGKLPRRTELQRTTSVRNSGLADKVLIGSRTHNFYRTIRTYKPDIIALGYDQKPTIPALKKDLRRRRITGLKVVRLKPYRPKEFKSSIINRGKV